MVLIGSLGVCLSFYSLWMTGQLETKWLKTVMTVVCGFICAAALLWIGYGVERGEFLQNRSVVLPVWIIGKK
jgi:hypothetical protein